MKLKKCNSTVRYIFSELNAGRVVYTGSKSDWLDIVLKIERVGTDLVVSSNTGSYRRIIQHAKFCVRSIVDLGLKCSNTRITTADEFLLGLVD